MSKVLPAAHCSQMSNPKAGTGQGGDRCVEATLAMIIATYHALSPGILGQWGDATPDQILYRLVEDWNSGRDVSALESGSRIDDYIAQNSGGKLSSSAVGGTFANVQTIIDRGHIAFAGVNDYRQLRLVDGSNPYQWNPATQPGPAGHVLLVVGYGAGVIVHDPLRSELTGQPAEYSVTSFEAAGWTVVDEIVGPRLDGDPLPQATTHVIQSGETLWGLADAIYGDPHLYTLLEEANPHVNPRALQIGSTITIPPKPESAATPAPEPPAPPEPSQHTIVAGDTFWGLAERYYGQGSLYGVIEAANPGADPLHLQVGSSLVIPVKP